MCCNVLTVDGGEGSLMCSSTPRNQDCHQGPFQAPTWCLLNPLEGRRHLQLSQKSGSSISWASSHQWPLMQDTKASSLASVRRLSEGPSSLQSSGGTCNCTAFPCLPAPSPASLTALQTLPPGALLRQQSAGGPGSERLFPRSKTPAYIY